MELLSFTLAAGETKRWERAGRYVEVIDATSAFSIYLTDANGGRVDYAINALSGIYLEGAYSAIEMTSATAQTVTLLVTDGRGGSRRQPGIVQVVDGERQKVVSGVAFRGVGAATGSSACVEVWNPVGSGKNLFIDEVRAGALNADSWGIQTSDFQLATAGNTPSNLDRSGAASVALMRTGDASTMTSVKGMGAGYIQASADTVFQLRRPIMVRPGFGCGFYLNGAANTVRATFEWEEWPV
jgi:hypothetical protein